MQTMRILREHLFVLLIAGISLIPVSCAHERCALRKNFCEGGQLTDAEVATVLRIAERVGIDRVEGIETNLGHPIGGVYVVVKEKEARKGNKVRYRTVTLCKRGWGAGRLEPKPDKIAIDDFQESSITQHELTVFEINGQTLRIALDPDISEEEAKPIVAALIARRWKSDEIFKTSLEYLDNGWIPSRLQRDTERGGYGCTLLNENQRLRINFLDFRFENGELIVTGAGVAVF
ncbi:MAG TPA: hypothetical protein PLQ35_15795 [bacterium]|nr:hypothetical protein [bacterium]HQL63745.1 hypothetical protein [bacterium]